MSKLTVLLLFCSVYLSLEEADNTGQLPKGRDEGKKSPFKRCAEEVGLYGPNPQLVYDIVRSNSNYVANETEKCYIACILLAKNVLTPTGEGNLTAEVEKARIMLEKTKTCNEIRDEDVNKAALKLQICLNKMPAQ